MADILTLQKQLEEDLLKLYGPVVTGDNLWKSLGYVSKDAFRQSIARGTLPVKIFNIENRRGKYALVKDIAEWLARQRFKHTRDHLPEGDNKE